jgi:F420-dependent methylenetetrahydromethanopterin dehydrogenase
MKRAAIMARELAVQTNTAIIVVRDGKIVRVTADELRQQGFGRTGPCQTGTSE